MNDNSDSKPETIAEKALWILEVLGNASKTREEYFLFMESNVNDFISKKVKFNEFGVPTKNENMYAALHIDFIFNMMRTIESFRGVIAAAWIYSIGKNPNIEKVLLNLFKPEGNIGSIQDKLRKTTLSEETICRFNVFPLLRDFPESTKLKMRKWLTPNFNRFEVNALAAQTNWDKYKDVRDVFSHNYRFHFFGEIYPDYKSKYDETVVGFLQDINELAGNMVYIGAYQRFAMKLLTLQLCRLERATLANLHMSILNDCKPVFPKEPLYLEKEYRDEYQSFWYSQNYVTKVPVLKVRSKIKVDDQVILNAYYLDIAKKVLKIALKAETLEGEIIEIEPHPRIKFEYNEEK